MRSQIEWTGTKSTFLQWEGIEHKLTGLLKLKERTYGGVIFPDGAGSFWE